MSELHPANCRCSKCSPPILGDRTGALWGVIWIAAILAIACILAAIAINSFSA